MLLFVPLFIWSQQDTTLFEEVTIKGNHLKVDQHTTLSKKDIQQLAPHDLGTLLQYVNGVTIKNYGGIGGMKTLSHRGLGGEHTRSEEHTSELQSRPHLVCRLLLEKKKKTTIKQT